VKDEERLDRAVEIVLTGGLALGALLLLLGLVRGSSGALRSGILVLMLTPVVRVIVVTIGMFARRDVLFGLVSLWILVVLVTSMGVAFRAG